MRQQAKVEACPTKRRCRRSYTLTSGSECLTIGVHLRACEPFAHFCPLEGLHQVLVVLLRGLDDWSEGEPVGVGQ